MIRFIIILVASCVAMEFVSYLAHRFVYHGIGWKLHRSHHEPRKGMFELNDVFPLIFASIAMSVMLFGLADPSRSDIVAVSMGISAYGVIYFFIHDLYVHRRSKRLRLRIPILMKLKKAHAIHHAFGGEPYGLLLFFKLDQLRNMNVREDEPV